MAQNVAGETLRQNYELQRKFNEFFRQINQREGYPFDFDQLMTHLQKGVEGKFFEQEIIHSDYKPIKKGIVIEAQERNRQEILNGSSKYTLSDNFKKILAKCKNGKTEAEVLRQNELLKRKTDKEIMKEMQISEISVDQIAERIIQLWIENWTIIGYCDGLVVCAGPDGGSRVRVVANELYGRDGGNRLLSRDIDTK
jgi:hypothetical protein